MDHPLILPKEYYDTPPGMAVRCEWSELLGNIDGIIYNKNDKYEVQANIENIVNLLIITFGLQEMFEYPVRATKIGELYQSITKIVTEFNFGRVTHIGTSARLQNCRTYTADNMINLVINQHNVTINITQNFTLEDKRFSGHAYLVIDGSHPDD